MADGPPGRMQDRRFVCLDSRDGYSMFDLTRRLKLYVRLAGRPLQGGLLSRAERSFLRHGQGGWASCPTQGARWVSKRACVHDIALRVQGVLGIAFRVTQSVAGGLCTTIRQYLVF